MNSNKLDILNNDKTGLFNFGLCMLNSNEILRKKLNLIFGSKLFHYIINYIYFATEIHASFVNTILIMSC